VKADLSNLKRKLQKIKTFKPDYHAIGKHLVTQLKHTIDNQHSLSFLDWSPSGGDGLAWHETGLLRDSLDYRVIEGKNGEVTLLVGVFNCPERAKIALWLEYGTESIPERPLFRTIIPREKEYIIRMIKPDADINGKSE